MIETKKKREKIGKEEKKKRKKGQLVKKEKEEKSVRFKINKGKIKKSCATAAAYVSITYRSLPQK